MLDVMKHDNLSEKEALKKIQDTDEERSRFLKSHHNCDIRDPTNFDLVWNVGRGELTDLVSTVAELVLVRLRRLRKSGAVHVP